MTERLRTRWVFEAVFIALSVALGFMVAQFGEYRADRQLTERVLASLQAEIQHNISTLKPHPAVHNQWVKALANADTVARTKAGLDVFFATRPHVQAGPQAFFPFLRRSAWEAALASGAFRLIDYEVAASLSEIYATQELLTSNIERLAKGVLAQPAIYDPTQRGAAVRLLWLTMADIEAAEYLLLDLYERELPRIRAANSQQ